MAGTISTLTLSQLIEQLKRARKELNDNTITEEKIKKELKSQAKKMVYDE